MAGVAKHYSLQNASGLILAKPILALLEGYIRRHWERALPVDPVMAEYLEVKDAQRAWRKKIFVYWKTWNHIALKTRAADKLALKEYRLRKGQSLRKPHPFKKAASNNRAFRIPKKVIKTPPPSQVAPARRNWEDDFAPPLPNLIINAPEHHILNGALVPDDVHPGWGERPVWAPIAQDRVLVPDDPMGLIPDEAPPPANDVNRRIPFRNFMVGGGRVGNRNPFRS